MTMEKRPDKRTGKITFLAPLKEPLSFNRAKTETARPQMTNLIPIKRRISAVVSTPYAP